ncbi:gliding motility-associated C-terminal domain-containing protein [Pedobacter sp. ok626]|uniref:Ig-like domain-containing protein n=1 Tax=Pedobacter sp. ok626 TaxID=1761882 RepID=UPI0011140559|nr:gliding motility-associated C-terminal domain-containing protein [Pedobacter sp. ok626]
MLKLLKSEVVSIYRKVCCVLILLLLMISFGAKADGSRDLYPSGASGNRAFLYSYDGGGAGTVYFPFRTPGTHYVYAKANEVIAVASSAQGLSNWFIRITSPRGTVTTTTSGKISTRNEELAGPRYVGQGAAGNYYVPNYVSVLAVDEGVWKIEFVSSNTSENADNVLANSNWGQVNNTSLLSAWDISVRNATNTSWLPGRVYTNVFNLRLSKNLDKSETAYYGINYVLTKDGRAYRVKNNGNNGYAFTFFSNNKGFLDNAGNPTYKSLDNTDVLNFVKDPRKEDDDLKNLVTHKLFYGPPAPDLPVSAPVSIEGVNTTTWLKNEAIVPNISGIGFTGSEGTLGQASQKGGVITFTANVPGSYRIVIPLGAGKDRVLTGAAVAGVNTIEWDGKDALNNVVPGGLIVPEVKVRLASAEVHFPFIDMEINPKGIIIELAENTTRYLINPTPAIIDESVYSDRVYWDDSDITGGLAGEKSDPIVNTLNGMSSNFNGHIWGSYSSDSGNSNNGKGTNSYGNEKAMDTYAYILSKEEAKPLNVIIKVADLEIVSIVPTVAITSLNQVSYQVKVKNGGVSDVTGAKFEFKLPVGFTVTGITRSFTNVLASENGIVQDISGYRSSLDLPANCEVTYTIVGTLDVAALGQDLHVEASIMRPKDVTDPDATNTVFDLAPTNPHDECKNGTAIEACNNIKYNTVKRLEVCAGSAISPFVYDLIAGGSSFFTEGMPGWLTAALSSGKVTFSGTTTTAGLYLFTVGTDASHRYKATYVINVNPLPTVVNQPVSTPVCERTDAVFSITSLAADDSYQWQYEEAGVWMNFVDGTGITGATTTALKILAIPVSFNGKKIRVAISSVSGCSTISSEITLVVNARPTEDSYIIGDEYICEGESIPLKSSISTPGFNFQWFLNGVIIPGANKRIYNATEGGKYEVAVVNTLGCLGSRSDSLVVTVTPFPTTPNITHGPLIVCTGNTVKLTSDSATKYQWYRGTEAISGATNRDYIADTSGDYSVLVSNIGGCKESSERVSVVISPLPGKPGITGTNIICDGDVAVLTASVGTTYQWYLEGSTISGAIGQTFDAKVAGKYTVVVTNANGCLSPISDEFTLTVNSLPAKPGITGTAIICTGDVSVLTASAGTDYQWYFEGAAITGATGQTYDAKVTGKYTVVVTNTNGCLSPISDEFILTVNVLPAKPGITGTTIICTGDVAVLTASAGTDYQWYLEGIVISGATGQTYDAKVAGKYTVIVTNLNGCFSPVSDVFTLTVNALPAKPGITGTNIICAGDVAVLTASAGTDYQWYLEGTAISGATGQTYDAKVTGKYTVVVTNSNGCFSPVSDAFTLTVNALPAKPGITGTNIICAGDVAVLTASAGTDYQWYLEGTAISGATGQTYDAKVTGKYTVVVTNSNGCFSPVSDAFTLTVNALPAKPGITGTNIICAGDVAVLTASAGTNYQWYLEGTAISGATAQTYDAKVTGKYTVVVTNSNGCFSPVSDAFILTVNALPAKPGITGTAMICTGDVAVLTASSGTNYQWYLEGTVIPGATAQTYDAKVAGKYTVVVTNTNGCFSPVSDAFTLTVNALPAKPGITGTAIICAGDVAVLTASTGTNYQWYLEGTAISGATAQTYDSKVAGKYTVVVTNTNGCFSPVSDAFTLTVNALPAKPGITGTAIICAGDMSVLTASAGTDYQWYLEGTAMSGATGQTYDAKVTGKYTVVVTNTNGCFSPVSDAFTLTVNALPTAPVITGTAIICEGDVAVLTSDLANRYQWYFNGTVIPGATGRTYDAKVAGKYTVVVTNSNGCFSPVSSEFILTVNVLPTVPVIAGTTIICEGDVAVLTSDVANGYQWYFNGVAISGATRQTYDAKVAGKYTVMVTNSNGCFSPVSNEITLTVNALPVRPAITGNAIICAGDVAVLTSDVANGYQWYFNGTAIPGATGKTYDAKVAGKYTVVVTNSNGCFSPVSNEITLTVNALPNAPVVTGTAIICEGDVAVLTSDLANGYQWYFNGTVIPGATGRTYDAKVAGKYTVMVTNSNGCFSPVSNEITLTVNAVPLKPAITGTAIICEGDVAVLTSDIANGCQWSFNGTAIPGATGRTYDAKLAGKYTVITTNLSGCSSPVSNEITLTVNALPVKPGITGTAVICEGDMAVLTSAIANGYQWYFNGTAIPGATGKTYDAKLAGNYTVITTNSNGCFSPVSNEFTITVNPLPVKPGVTGTAVICEGDVAVLTSDVATGCQWYFNGTVIPGATGGTYDAKLAGKYTVITTNANGCFSPVSNEFILTVNSLPPVPTIMVDANKLNFCEGSSVILTSSSATGNQWYKNSQIIPGATNKAYTATTSGTYTVLVTNSNGCSSTSASPSVEVTAVPYPEVPEITPGGRTTFCEGRHVVLTSSSLTGNQWYKNGVLIPGATNQTFNVNQIGDYTVKVTNTTGCASGISATTIVTVNQVPKGYNDVVNSLSCTRSAFSYDLQNNVNNTIKGGNAVPATFTWTANSTVVTGVSNGSGKTLNATLINTSTTAQTIIYTVTPRGETGGCAGDSFTITVNVPVCVDIAISKTADKSSVSAVGDKIKYTITVYNNGNANHNQVVVNDPLLGGILSQPKGDNGNGILEKNESWTYDGVYTISQNDLDVAGFPLNGSGKIVNTATVRSLEYTSSKTATVDVAVLTNPLITLVKTGRLNRDFKTLTYTFRITNTGNVTLSNLDLIDAKIPGTITLKQTVLAPGATLVTTVDYTITEAEKIVGTTTNTATVNGFTNQSVKVSDISGTAADNDDPTVIDITRNPVAIDDFASTKAEEPVAVPIVMNDRPAFFPLDVATVDVKSLPTNGTLSVEKDGKVTYKPNKGFYGIERFTYKINDANGLPSNIAEVRIDVAPPPLEIPNTFTPNGDGKNDTFFIKGMENYEGVSFFVYNRWGDEVYRNLNYKNEWDGKGLNDGTYFYVLKMKKGSSEDVRRSWILLKR